MIDLSLGEMLEIAREAELQRRLEADGIVPRDEGREAFPDLCVVVLLRDVEDDDGLPIHAGAKGTVLERYNGGEAYEVEFTDEPYQQPWAGGRLGLATVPPDAMRLASLPGDPVTMPEDLRGKLGDPSEAGEDGSPPHPPQRGTGG